MDRRAFVKVSAGVAGGVALGAAGVGLVRIGLPPRPAPLPTYFGAEAMAGPAPRGVPFVPITVEDGAFVAKTTLRPGGRELSVLDWHRFCGRRDAPGLREDFTRDNRLIDHRRADYDVITPWFKDRFGEPVRPEDFPDTGFGAAFLWRSHGVSEGRALPGVIVKLDPSELTAPEEPGGSAPALTRDEWDFVRREVFHEGFVAFSAVCTHFCCVAGYKEAERLARARGAWERLFCTCHNAQFDPRRAVAYRYDPEVDVIPPTG